LLAANVHAAIRVTYLGVNGYEFETDGHALLVDPYFTRVGFWSAALNKPIHSRADRVDEGYKHIEDHPDGILVTHAHFDHLLDVPELMRRTGAKLFAGPTAVDLVRSLGRTNAIAVQPGDVRRVGPWTVRVLAAEHDRLFGKVPFRKCAAKPPTRPSDWCVGEPLAFVIEADGKHIYIDSGGIPDAPPNSRMEHVDLAIIGVALPDSRKRFAKVVRQLQPRYVLPSHQDDMFAPLSRGFHFGKLTDYPALKRTHEKEHLPGQMIVLDYFRPWTLR
jgi:L-ascorbate metabolism protein UlaG (beta-lactamase superfamily)